METDETQQLIIDFALGTLDIDKQLYVQHLLQTDPQAQALLAELTTVFDTLNLSVEPVELPSGSLQRLRHKANASDLDAKVATNGHIQPSTSIANISSFAEFKPDPLKKNVAGVFLSKTIG